MQALEIAPEQVHFQFNVAFVQIQVAQLLYTLPESKRTLEDVQAAAKGLDEAIESFDKIAKSKNPPYPRNDLELRADMGRNTMRRQLERAIAAQKEYEEKNAAKLQLVKKFREAAAQREEETKQKAAEKVVEEKRRIADERQKMLALDREITAKREEAERLRIEVEFETNSETGEKTKKRTKRGGRRKKSIGSGSDAEQRPKSRKRRSTGSGLDSTDDESSAPKKRRKLQRKAPANNKYKSSEIVVESDSDDEDAVAAPANGATSDDGDPGQDRMDVDGREEGSEEDEGAVQRQRSSRKKISRAIGSDSEDKDDETSLLSPAKDDADDAGSNDGNDGAATAGNGEKNGKEAEDEVMTDAGTPEAADDNDDDV